MAADEMFVQNLMRMIAAELHMQNVMTASQQMFGRGYISLSPAERIAVDQAVVGFVGTNYREITPDNLAGQESRQPMGFLTPQAGQSS